MRWVLTGVGSSYLRAHDMIRSITGVGEGHGPYMMIHDVFNGLQSWYDYLPGSDRIGIGTFLHRTDDFWPLVLMR